MKKTTVNEPSFTMYNVRMGAAKLGRIGPDLLTCEIQPGQVSDAHAHYEHEAFLFLSGDGEVHTQSGGESVTQGVLIEFDAYEIHWVKNTGDEPLRFISIVWEDIRRQTNTPAPGFQRATIYSTPPTPNGDLHLGHLSGPYLAGDFLRRTLLRSGVKASHASGRDDHQTYVDLKARKEGREIEDVAEYYANLIQSTWHQFDIQMDGFIRPNRTGAYAEFVRAGIDDLLQQGYVYQKEVPVAHDASGRYLHEAFVRGICPHCQQESDGNACEACGQPNQCVDLLNSTNRMTQEPVVVGKQVQLFFKLSAFEEALRQYVRQAAMPAKVVSLCMTMLDNGLPDICISHQSEWGIQHRVEGFENTIIYVWFEMAFGYLWNAAGDAESDDERWQKITETYSADNRVVHAYGFDNAYYHTLLFPAVYLALSKTLTPPQVHVVNELLDLDGAKFSTSRGHLIWGRDFAATLPVDYARFILALMRPEGERSNFQYSEAIRLLNELFPQRLKNILDRFSSALNDDYFVPNSGAWNAEQQRFHKLIDSVQDDLSVSTRLETFSPRQTARSLQRLIIQLDEFVGAQLAFLTLHTESLKHCQRTCLALIDYALRIFSIHIEPLMPSLGAQLARWLNLDVDTATLVFGQTHVLNVNAEISLPEAQHCDALATTPRAKAATRQAMHSQESLT